jgi:hypothetical protein
LESEPVGRPATSSSPDTIATETFKPPNGNSKNQTTHRHRKKEFRHMEEEELDEEREQERSVMGLVAIRV